MATITDELVLNIAQPLRQFDSLERALDESVTSARRLTTEMNQINRATGNAANEARDFESRLQDAERSAARLTTETQAMALSAGRSVGDFTDVAQALGVSEAAARRVSTEVLEAQAAANRLQDASIATARSLGLSEDEAQRFASSMARATRETRDTADAASTLDSRFASIRTSVIGLVAGFGAFAAVRGIVRGLNDLVDSFVEFDQAITQSLAIVSNVTPEIRQQFEAVARTVSETLRFSAAEAAEAFFFLASAGFDVSQQLQLLPQVAEFAQAGMFDLSTATTLLADSTSALGLRTKDTQQQLKNLTRVADVLTKANILSNAEVQQFAEALTNDAAAAARLVGVEVEEVVATLAVFADQGQKGAAAGTAFAIVLRDLQRAALENPDAFRDLGIAVFDTAGEFRPLADVIGEMEQALDGMSDAQRRATVIALGFQDRSVANLLTLLGTSQAIRDYTIQLQAAGGATEDLAERQLLSLGARLDIARQKFENVKIELGEALVPAIEAFLEILPGVVDAVEDLAPGLESIARSAANAAPGIASMASALINFLEAVPRSAAILGELGQTAVDVERLGRAFAGLVSGTIFGRFDQIGQSVRELGEGMVRVRDNVEQIQFNRLEQGLVDAIQEGRDAILSLADTLAALDESAGGVTFENIARLARTAGVEGRNLAAVFRALITDATRLGLSAAQIRVFELALRDLTEGNIEAVRQTRITAAAVAELPTAIEIAAERIVASADPISRFFSEIDTVLEETGLSFSEFVLKMGDTGNALLDALSPAERLSVTLLAIQLDADTAAEHFRANLTPSIIGVTQALEDLNQDGSTSLDEFITNLEEVGTASLNFRANLAIIALTAPGLADALAQLPTDVGAALAQKLIKEGRIAEAELARTLPAELARTIDQLVTQAIGLLQTDPGRVAEFTEFVSTLDIPGAVEAITTGVNEALGISFRQLDPVELELADILNVSFADLDDLGGAAFNAFAAGFISEAQARSGDFGQAVKDAVEKGLEISSPSKVMIAIGEIAGESLLMGFASSANRPIPSLTGLQFGGTTASGGGQSVVFNNQNVINNPATRDLLSDVARLEQLTGATAASLRAFNAGL